MAVRVNPAPQTTPRQLELLKAIADFQASHCYSPTIGELAAQLRISRSTVFEHITALREKALLSGSPGRARSLNPTLRAQELLEELAGCNLNCLSQQSKGIPLAGRIAAGPAIEAIENKEDFSLSSHFGDPDDTFALEVAGDSMLQAGIRSGDYVICRRSRTADNGQLVVAIVDDENATLKRFYKEKTSVRLQPANEDYEPIWSENCRIEAVVVGLVRKL